MASERVTWVSRTGFVLAAAGSAVGLGNIWRFPAETAANGGGVFVLTYLVAVIAIGLPVMMAEVMLGARGRGDVQTSIENVAVASGRSPAWGYFGIVGVVCAVLIMGIYSVVAGWVLWALSEAVSGDMATAGYNAGEAFDELLASPGTLLFWHVVFSILTYAVVARGVNKGIEASVNVMMPLLFVSLIALVIYSVAVGDARAAFDYLFSWRAEDFTIQSVMRAIGQAFFSLSLGMGALLTYGAYMRDKANIPGRLLATTGLDTSVALIAGVAIFPLVFAFGLEAAAGPTLIFATLPQLFQDVPGGQFLGIGLFGLLGVAALSSSISLFEAATAYFIQRFHLPRIKAALIPTGITLVLGTLSALSFNVMSGVTVLGDLNVFDTLDFLTADILLPLGGTFMVLFAGWLVPKSVLKEQMAHGAPIVWTVVGFLWKFILPPLILAIMVSAVILRFGG